MPRAKPRAKLPRVARQAYVEHILRTDSCPERRRWAARELGKLWAEEALEEIRRRLA
jgi:hypothetical protein